VLPLLPALILLIFQGSNVERLAHEGRLPAALQAAHRQMLLEPQGPLGATEESVLASLLAASRTSPELSEAMFRLLLGELAPTPVAEAAEIAAFESHVAPPPADERPLDSPFVESQRSRDGPWVR
jgi:hypothetical protein